MSPGVLTAANTLRDFLFERVYRLRSAQAETDKAVATLHRLYQYLREHQDELPVEYRIHRDDEERGVVDYISGMTDYFALRKAEEISYLRIDPQL